MVVFCWFFCLFPTALILKAGNKVTKSTCLSFKRRRLLLWGAAEHYRAAAEHEELLESLNTENGI